jgi:uncharacterized repeat protein (TIGR01451 family)/fimbrial isopeptide formation D2 family protein
MSRRSPLLGFGLAWACLLALLALLLPVAARAEGKPNLGLSVTSPKSVLFGAKATITLEASNPTGEPYGYNLSYRAVLPEGVSYVAKSTKIGTGGMPPEPTVIANQPATGKTTLIWSNVGDLSPASHSTLSFEVTPSQVTYPVASEFTVPAEAFVAEAPRYLPKFKVNGEPKGPESTSFTGYAKGSAKTAISALEIKQEEGSPEGEILRGVHDHQTVYKVTVTNNKVNATTNVNVDDWLPASLEYLGCGGAGSDHTTEAPTNPGSKEEYPGSGPIEVAALGGCTAPGLVETVETDPDGAGEDPTAVYTHVRWTVAELKPGESRTFEFRAAVPLRENTTAWTGAEPTPASGHQAANLDNNSGKETKDGESLVTFAKAEGLYKGTTPVSAEEHMTRVAKDLTTEKSADLKTLSDGQVSKWTILVHSSEYRYNTKVEVTDTLPNGLCPLSSTNLTPSAECEPNKAPSSPYTTAAEEENGTWKLLWNETTDPALATLKQNETTTITFYSNTRTHYQSKHAQAGPILSNDKIENTVIASATTNVVCENDTDCSVEGAKPIDHERPLSEPVQDNSHFTQSAEGPAIKKEIAASGTNCLGDTYTGATPVYHPGDLICWRLQASFPATLSTHGTEVTDFLPELVLFDEAFNAGKGEAPTSEDTLPATTFDDSEAPGTEPGGALKWTLPESGIVGNGSQRFERVFATKATLTQGTPLGDLQGNLMKFASINSAGESFALRAEANFKLQFPQLSLLKQIVKINGAAFGPATSATVKGGSEVEFALTVKNAGEVEALNTEVRDLLPNGIACAEIVAGSISNKGACASGVITWGETGLGQEAIGVPALGQTVLHFSVKLSTALDPATTLEDKAGVREYHSATNTGGEYTYIPAENIDPLLSEKEANVPAANAHASVKTEEVTLTKAHTTSVNETGNKANEATIGEEVTFEVTATIPSGTTLSGFAKITDPSIPTTRLTYEAGSVEALVNGSTAPGTFKHEDIAGSPVVTLPENYAAPATESVKVTMRFRTRVANVALNNAAGSAAEKAIPNKGKLAWTNPLSGAQTREAGNEVPLVEPSIALTEKNNTAEGKVHGGQLVEYKLELQNAASASTAFDSVVVDTVPLGLTLSNAKGEPYKEGEVIESGGVWNEKARTITWTLTPIESNHEIPLVFFAKVNEEPVSSTILTNKAIATTTSIAGASASERTAANAPTTEIKAHYESESKGALEVEGATIAKAGSPEQATIGEKVTYTLTVTVPARTAAFNDTVIDTLPSTLELAGYTSAKCVSGCAAGPTEIEPKPYMAENNVAAHTNRVAWYLGNITGAPEVRVLKLIYVAIVRSTPRGGGAEVKAPAVLENSASLYYNTTDSGYTFKVATVPPASFNKTVGPVQAKTTVIEPSVEVVKEASVDGGTFSTTTPFKVTDGDTITYRLQVTNSGTAPAYNVSVTDALPASGLTEVKTVANAPITSHEAEVTHESASELAWTIPALGTPTTPGKTITLEYTAKLAPVTTLHQGQEIANTAKVPSYFGVPAAERTGKSYFNETIEYRTYAGNEKTLKAKVALPTITIEKAALEGAKYQASANAEVGQPFTWRVIVKNTSSVAAKNLKVADKLPPNWEYAGGASFTKGGSLTPTEAGALEPGRELTWSTSIELAAGASTTLTYQAKPTLAAESNPGSGPTHPNKNTASATVLDAAGNPEDAEGPFAAGPATAQGILIVPILEVTKIAAKASVAAGEKDSYKIRIHNSGAGVAREVLAEDTLPTGMTYKAGSATALPTTGFSEKSASATKVVWEVVSIAAGASVEIEVPVGTEASLASGTKLKNIVAVHAVAAPTPVEAEGTITLTTSADLEASKEVLGKGPYVPGEKLTYKIGATNKGPSVAKGVKLTDKLPSGETFVKASSAKCKAAGQLVTCEEAELAPGATVSFEIEVELASGAKGAIVNTVLVKSETLDPEEKNNERSATITPEPRADLKLEKKALVSPVVLGETASFELIVTNKGPSDAEGVQIVDHLPSGLVYKSASGAEASCKAGGAEGREVTCTLPKALVAEGKAAVVLVLETKALGTLLNKATVSSAAKDTEPLNNSSEASVLVVSAPALTKEAGGPAATIGQRVKYTLTLTLPAHLTTYDHTVIDTLPDTLDFDEYSSAQCTAGCAVETTPAIHTYKPAREVSGTTRIAWDLGDVPASEAARMITLTYFASVRSTRYVAGGEVKAGEALENTASDYYDQTNKQSFNENTIPAPGSFDRAGSPQSTSTPVVEPALTLTKEASVDGGEFKAAPFTIAAGDTVAYRLKVKNTGTSPAYTADVGDTPPHGLAVIETVPNPAATVTKAWSEATPEIDWQIAGPLAVGETVTLEYKAKLVVGSAKDGQKLTNTASVPSYFGAAEAERGEGKENYFKEKILYRKYAGPSAQLVATVTLPVLEVSKEAVKATVAAGEEDTYKIVVKNTGTGVAHEVFVEDTLPPGMTYKAHSATASPPAGFSEKSASATSIVWEVTSIAAGKSVEIEVPVGTEASLPSGKELKNKVAVHSVEAPTPVETSGTITLSTSAELSATKEVVGSAKAVPGKPLTYEVTTTNHGPSRASEVKLVDHLPTGLTYKKSSPAGCSEETVGVVTCAVVYLEPEQTAAFQIEVELAPNLTGTISNTVIAKSTTPDPKSKVEATSKVEASPEADLVLEKTALESEVTDGQQAAFELTVMNEGPSDAQEAKVVDTLPAGLKYVSAKGATCTAEGQEVTCPLGTLVPGAHVSFELVTEAVAPGKQVNSASVSSPTKDPEPNNNEAMAEVEVAPAADLQIVKTAAPSTVKVGENVTYTLAVFNNGPDAAQSVLVSDDLPAGESYVSDNAGCKANVQQEVKCELGELAKGAKSTIQIVVKIGVTLSKSTVANTAVVSSPTADPEPLNNKSTAEVEVEPAADLQIVKTALTPEVLDGQQAVFSLAVTNKGPDAAVAAKIVDTLPAGLTYVNATGASCTAVGQEVTCTLGTLTSGASVTVELTTQPTGLGSYTNTAEVSSTTPDPEPGNNSSEATVTVAPAADLALEKTAPAIVVSVPGEVTYTLTVTNHGPDAAQKVVVTDPLPVGETYVSDDAGCIVAGQTVTCALGELADGATWTIHLHVSVGVALSERTVTNTAEVTSATGDPVKSNNTAQASIQTGPAPSQPATNTTSPPAPSSASGVSPTTAAMARTRVTLRKLVREHVIAPGGRLGYRLIVRNAGARTAEKLRVCDNLPEQTTVLNRGGAHLSGARICFTLATLAAGHTHTFTIVLRADSDAHGQIVNHATVTGRNFDPAHAQASTPVQKASLAPARENHVTG